MWNLELRSLCSPFYQVLVRTSTEDREAALKLLKSNLDELEAGLPATVQQSLADGLASIPSRYIRIDMIIVYMIYCNIM